MSEEVSKATRIQYGGSVNDGNCEDLAKHSDIDGSGRGVLDASHLQQQRGALQGGWEAVNDY